MMTSGAYFSITSGLCNMLNSAEASLKPKRKGGEGIGGGEEEEEKKRRGITRMSGDRIKEF